VFSRVELGDPAVATGPDCQDDDTSCEPEVDRGWRRRRRRRHNRRGGGAAGRDYGEAAAGPIQMLDFRGHTPTVGRQLIHAPLVGSLYLTLNPPSSRPATSRPGRDRRAGHLSTRICRRDDTLAKLKAAVVDPGDPRWVAQMMERNRCRAAGPASPDAIGGSRWMETRRTIAHAHEARARRGRGIAAAPVSSLDDSRAGRFGAEARRSSCCSGEPRQPTRARRALSKSVAGAFPETGVVMLAEELTWPMMSGPRVRAGVRPRCDSQLDSGRVANPPVARTRRRRESGTRES